MRAVVLAFLFVAAQAFAAEPNGTIVERAAVTLTEAEQKDVAELLARTSVERITYISDGLKVKGFLAMPKDGSDRKLPCVIFNRGGNPRLSVLTSAGAVRSLGLLAARGYVVVAGQYRGADGGEGQDEFGGADVNDVLALIPLLEKEPRADATRIGMYGWSRGGLMTYIALAKTDRLRAAIIGAGVSDSFDTLQKRPEMKAVYEALVPKWKDEQEAALVARSPIRWAEKLHKSTPILLLQGTGDWRVDPGQTLRMATRLFELRHPFRLVMYEGGDHGLTEWRPERNQAVFEFLDRYVRDGKPWPPLEPHGN